MRSGSFSMGAAPSMAATQAIFLPVGPQDVFGGAAVDGEILGGDVAQAHAQVVKDVLPLPSPFGGDGVEAIHHVVEHTVQAGMGKGLHNPRRCKCFDCNRRFSFSVMFWGNGPGGHEGR